MAFLKFTSDNKNFSWVIQKNPATGMVLKPLRAGFLFGYFPKRDNQVLENEYCIYFKDTSDEISYRVHPNDESFEYLSTSKYNDARFLTDAIQELLHTAREGAKEDNRDEAGLHELHLNLLATDFKTVAIFRRYFKELVIDAEEVSKNNFKVVFKNVEPITISHFLKLINLFGIFAILNSDNYIYLDAGLIEKYLKLINTLDTPYFIRYLFKIRLLRSEKKYLESLEALQATNRYSIKMQFGDTHDMRIAFIKSKLAIDLPIVDIGAGIDFRYMKAYAEHLQNSDLPYYAIEIDEDARERMKAAAKNRGWSNVQVFESLDDFLTQYSNERVNVLCTEVLEHNELNAATSLIKTVTDKLNYNSFIITVPNAEFNQFYGMETEFRHLDHKWEMSEPEFISTVEKLNLNAKTLEFIGVGDKVNDIAVSNGLVIKSETFVQGKLIPPPPPQPTRQKREPRTRDAVTN